MHRVWSTETTTTKLKYPYRDRLSACQLQQHNKKKKMKKIIAPLSAKVKKKITVKNVCESQAKLTRKN